MDVGSWFIVSVIAFMALGQAYVAWKISKLRARGIYPQKGQATLVDVVRLRDSGFNNYAIRCYREINMISLAKAKIAVEALSN